MRHFLVPPKSRCATSPCASSRSVIVTFWPLMTTVAVALAHAAPRHAPRRELAHRLGRGVDEHAHDVLVGAPVAAAHRVLEVDVLVVALALDHVAEQACMPPCAAFECERLGGTSDRMIASWPRRLARDRQPQPGEPAADDQDVGVDDLHCRPALRRRRQPQAGT